jgi:hypothetical protein
LSEGSARECAARHKARHKGGERENATARSVLHWSPPYRCRAIVTQLDAERPNAIHENTTPPCTT